VYAFFAALAVFVATAVVVRSAGRPRRWALAFSVAAAGATVWLAPGGLALDKVIARLVLPAGLVWLFALSGAWWALVRKRHRAAATWALFGTLYWFAGAPVVGQWLIRRVEAPYAEIDPLGLPPLDAAVVLGGGTRDVGGRPRLHLAGDRVLLGAQLYREGKVRTLITTGSSIPELGPPRDLTEETARLWSSLGIPSDAIVRLPQPKNTKQEIDVVEAFVETSTTIETLGLVTSAWHLPRALALCEREGLEVVPLPADVRSDDDSGDALEAYIPDGPGFHAVHRAGWELLGRAVGR